MENLFWIFKWLAYYLKPHVLMVALLVNFSTVFANTVDEPSFIEGSSFSFWEEVTEIADCNLQIIEHAFQDVVDCRRVLWPVSGDWVQAFKYNMDSLFKVVFSLDKPDLNPMSPTKVSSEASQKNSPKDSAGIVDYVINHPFWIPVIAFLFWFPIFVLKT